MLFRLWIYVHRRRTVLHAWQYVIAEPCYDRALGNWDESGYMAWLEARAILAGALNRL